MAFPTLPLLIVGSPVLKMYLPRTNVPSEAGHFAVQPQIQIRLPYCSGSFLKSPLSALALITLQIHTHICLFNYSTGSKNHERAAVRVGGRSVMVQGRITALVLAGSLAAMASETLAARSAPSASPERATF